MKELHADHLSIGYFGSAPLEHAGLPPYRVLGREEVVPGYVAVSLRYLYLDNAKNGSYQWIKGLHSDGTNWHFHRSLLSGPLALTAAREQ